MAELVAKLRMEDGGFTSGIASATSSLQKLDKQATLSKRGLDNFFKGQGTDEMKKAFDGVDRVLSNLEKKMGSAGTGMKQQLRAMTVAAQELEQTYRNLSEAEKQSGAGQELRNHIDELIAKAGELKDTMGDVQGAIKFASSDTAQLQAFAQGLTVLSAGAQAATGALTLFGVSEEKAAKIQKTIITLIGITNGLQTIQNALQKESNLMQFISIARTKGLAVALGIKTAATVAATAAENAETAAVEANTAAWAMNPIGAIIVALLALVAGVVAVTKAVNDNSKAVNDNSGAMKSNSVAAEANLILKERLKKSEADWSKAVTQNASSQIEQYTRLQLKWQECNRDQKLREKFQKEYGDEVNRVAGKVMKLIDYEDFFVRNTDAVVDAILARAAAEASAQKYAEAILKKAENDRNGTVANGRYYYVKHEGDWVYTTELDKYGIPLTEAQRKQRSGEARQSGETNVSNSSYIQLTKSQAEALTNVYHRQADAIRAADDAEVDYWHNFAVNANKNAAIKAQAAGMGDGYNPPGAFGGGGGSHGGSGGGSGSKPEEEVKPVAQSLQWLRDQVAKLQKELSYGLIPADQIDLTKEKIDYLKKDIEKKEIELGFKVVPVEGSLNDLEKQLRNLQNDLKNGLIPDEDIDKTIEQIEKLKDDITAKEIELGIKLPPKTAFEALELAGKYKNDWNDLTKYISDYGAKAEQFAAAMKKYEDDLKAYNDAWAEYNSNMAKYNQQQEQFAKYNELLKKSEELENKHDNDQISDDKYLKERTKLDEQLDKLSNQLWPVDNSASEELTDFNAKIAELGEKMQQGLITAEEYNAEFEKLCQQGEQLDNVMVRGFAKPIKPKIELPKKPFNPLVSAPLEEIFPALDNIPEHIQELIQAVEEKLKEDDLSVLVRAELNTTRDKLQERLDNITKGEISIKAKIEPSYIQKGSDWDKRNSYLNQSNNIQRIQQDYEIGLIGYDEAIKKIAELNEELKKMGLKPVILEIKSPMFEQLDNAANVLNQFGDAVSKLGEATDNLALKAAATIAQAIANIWLGYSQASVQSAKLGPWAWLGFSAGALAQVIGVITALKSNSFAGGGIVGGSSWHGDRLYARVNSGEAILNKRQQSNLFRLIDGGHPLGNGSANVEFKIKGTELVGCIKNYNDKHSKLR